MRGFLSQFCCSFAKTFGGCNPEPIPVIVPSLQDYINYARNEVGGLTRLQIPLNTIKAELTAVGIQPMFTADPDDNAYCVDEDSLRRIIPFLTFPAEYYVANLDIDCDDYALWASAFARLLFNVNGIFQAWGQMDLGYHAFNIARVSDNKYKLFDANAGFPWAGEPFEIGGNSYRPDKFK